MDTTIAIPEMTFFREYYTASVQTPRVTLHLSLNLATKQQPHTNLKLTASPCQPDTDLYSSQRLIYHCMAVLRAYNISSALHSLHSGVNRQTKHPTTSNLE